MRILGAYGGGRLMAANPNAGYWTTTWAGNVTAYGGAPTLGSPASFGIHLNQPILSMASTPSGHGYWLVASDGGVFSFGNAIFYGSTGSIHLNKPIVGIAPTPSGRGYWLVASDGGIFSYGDAQFYRIYRRAAPQPTHRRHGGYARRRGLLARSVRRWHLQFRRCTISTDRPDRSTSTNPSLAWLQCLTLGATGS